MITYLVGIIRIVLILIVLGIVVVLILVEVLFLEVFLIKFIVGFVRKILIFRILRQNVIDRFHVSSNHTGKNRIACPGKPCRIRPAAFLLPGSFHPPPVSEFPCGNAV